MFAKRFFFVCAGIFLLALSYHLGARSATAQNREGATAVALVVYPDASGVSQLYALTANGDVYCVTDRTGTWNKNSNIFNPDVPAKLPWPDQTTAKGTRNR